MSGTKGPSRYQTMDEDHRPCLFRYITAVARLWAFAVLGIMWLSTVQLIKYRDSNSSYVPWYILAVSIVLTFFEITWILNKLACCADDGQSCCLIWRGVMWMDSWKKFILYSILAVPCFLHGNISPGVFSYLAGAALISLAIIYLLKSLKYCACLNKPPKEPIIIGPNQLSPNVSTIVTMPYQGPSEDVATNTVTSEFTQTNAEPQQARTNPFDDLAD